MKQIEPYNPSDPEILSKMEYIMEHKPLKNLNTGEVLATLRLIEIQKAFSDNEYDEIVVHKNDKRLELCDDNDRFLAMLADVEKRETILCTKRCRSLFGGTIYRWRKIARNCPITSVASAIHPDGGGGYYGRGWIIAAHIARLIKWISENIK